MGIISKRHKELEGFLARGLRGEHTLFKIEELISLI